MRGPAARSRSTEVVKIYDAGGARVLAVDHCSLPFPAGEICMIVGPSGCGKTTLLNAIAGLSRPRFRHRSPRRRSLCGPGQPQAPVGSRSHRRLPERRAFPVEDQSRQYRFRPDCAEQAQQERRPTKRPAPLMADAGLSGYENKYPGEIVLRPPPPRRNRPRADQRTRPSCCSTSLIARSTRSPNR